MLNNAVIEPSGPVILAFAPLITLASRLARRGDVLVRPKTATLILSAPRKQLAFVEATWGLCPPWIENAHTFRKVLSEGRLESMAGDSNFQRALASRRCVVLARSVVLRDGRDQVVRHAAGELLRLAGVFEHNTTGVRDYRSFALLCRKVQSDAPVRPASLNAAGVALWLSATPTDWQNPEIWDESVMLRAV